LFDRKILAVQINWGGEYQKLNTFFQQVGISHHVSCPYAHQQNGLAEWKHHHIVEFGLSLLSHASMPPKYWDEAFLAATYLINHLPSKTLDFSSPLERLFKEKPNYCGLCTFVCVCWPNLRPFNTHKLQFRSKQCVFLGYNNMHKGFKCLDVSEGCIYISRDVVFDKTVYTFSMLNPNAGSRLRSEILLLPTYSQPSNLPSHGDKILDLSSVNASVNLVSANPSCSPKVFAENFHENGVVFNRFKVVQGRRMPGTEHDWDLSQSAAIPPTSDHSGCNPEADLALSPSDRYGPES
jgi:hypothetical protein